MGKKIIFTKKQDQFLKDNYLLLPILRMAKEFNVKPKTIYRRLRELNLSIPPTVTEIIKRTHRAVNEPPKTPKKYYVPKPKKIEPKPKKKPLPEKKAEPIFANKIVDYSLMRMVKIDHKTWKYVAK